MPPPPARTRLPPHCPALPLPALLRIAMRGRPRLAPPGRSGTGSPHSRPHPRGGSAGAAGGAGGLPPALAAAAGCPHGAGIPCIPPCTAPHTAPAPLPARDSPDRALAVPQVPLRMHQDVVPRFPLLEKGWKKGTRCGCAAKSSAGSACPASISWPSLISRGGIRRVQVLFFHLAKVH